MRTTLKLSIVTGTHAVSASVHTMWRCRLSAPCSRQLFYSVWFTGQAGRHCNSSGASPRQLRAESLSDRLAARSLVDQHHRGECALSKRPRMRGKNNRCASEALTYPHWAHRPLCPLRFETTVYSHRARKRKKYPLPKQQSRQRQNRRSQTHQPGNARFHTEWGTLHSRCKQPPQTLAGHPCTLLQQPSAAAGAQSKQGRGQQGHAAARPIGHTSTLHSSSTCSIS